MDKIIIMLSFRVVLFLFLVALISLVGSTNGGCDSSPSWADMADEQTRRSAENADKFGRITLDCGGGSNGGSGGGSSGLETIIEIFVGLFVLIWIAIGIWFIFFKRSQMAMNAAAVNKPYQGGVGAQELQGNGMNEKTKTVSMSTGSTGKIPNGDTNV